MKGVYYSKPFLSKAFSLLYLWLLGKFPTKNSFSLFYILSISTVFGFSLWYIKRYVTVIENLNSYKEEISRKSLTGRIKILFAAIAPPSPNIDDSNIIIFNYKVKTNALDVLSIILKKIGSSKFSLIKSEYLADMAKGEFFKSNLDKNIILKDYYDRKHSIPHLRTIIFQNQMSKPGI